MMRTKGHFTHNPPTHHTVHNTSRGSEASDSSTSNDLHIVQPPPPISSFTDPSTDTTSHPLATRSENNILKPRRIFQC